MYHATRFACALVLLLGARAAPAQPPGSRSTDYHPLNKGARWTYKVGEQEVVVLVAGTERFNDEDCVRVETRGGDVFTTDELFAVRADGLYRVQARRSGIVPPVKVLPNPVKAGDTWAVNSKLDNQTAIKGTFAVKSDREQVKVPAGAFDTVLVEGRDIDVAGVKMTMRIWFAKNVGIVKQEVQIQANEAVVLELSKFEPGTEPPVPPAPPAPAEAAWAFPQTDRILPVQCIVLPVTTQEYRGCCARSVRCWARRR